LAKQLWVHENSSKIQLIFVGISGDLEAKLDDLLYSLGMVPIIFEDNTEGDCLTRSTGGSKIV
jgi:hypothetical protein